MNQNLFILVLALAGLAVAFYINYKKTKKEKLVCVIGKDCDKVVNSRYSSVFGIDNQILGMIYYLLLAAFAIFSLAGLVWPAIIFSVFRLMTVGAILFSIFLVGVQAFILREWCEWCLGSALINFLIGLVVFI